MPEQIHCRRNGIDLIVHGAMRHHEALQADRPSLELIGIRRVRGIAGLRDGLVQAGDDRFQVRLDYRNRSLCVSESHESP